MPATKTKVKKKKVEDEHLEVTAKKKKKRKPKAEQPKKKKKKTSKSKELSVVDAKAKKKANAKLERRLEKRKAKITELAVEAELLPATVNSESVFLEEYSHIFESLQELTRIAEAKYAKSEQSRDIYALMSMYSQMRECIADMRAIKDLNAMSDSLIRAILDPLLRSVGQVILENYFKMEKEIKATVKNKATQEAVIDLLKSTTQESAAKVQDHFAVSKEQVFTYFSENG